MVVVVVCLVVVFFFFVSTTKCVYGVHAGTCLPDYQNYLL